MRIVIRKAPCLSINFTHLEILIAIKNTVFWLERYKIKVVVFRSAASVEALGKSQTSLPSQLVVAFKASTIQMHQPECLQPTLGVETLFTC